MMIHYHYLLLYIICTIHFHLFPKCKFYDTRDKLRHCIWSFYPNYKRHQAGRRLNQEISPGNENVKKKGGGGVYWNLVADQSIEKIYLFKQAFDN